MNKEICSVLTIRAFEFTHPTSTMLSQKMNKMLGESKSNSIQYKRTLCFLIPRHLSFTFGPNSHVNSSIHSDHNNNFITIRGKYYLAIKIIFYDNSKFSEKNVYWFHVKTQKFQISQEGRKRKWILSNSTSCLQFFRGIKWRFSWSYVFTKKL